jgi:hypothetical protein
MSEPKIPSAEEVQKTIARSRRARQEIAMAAIDLQDLILKLEEINNQQRKQQLEKRLNLSS